MIPHISFVRYSCTPKNGASDLSLQFVHADALPNVLLFDLKEVVEPFVGFTFEGLRVVERHVDLWLKEQVRADRLWYDRINKKWRYLL